MKMSSFALMAAGAAVLGLSSWTHRGAAAFSLLRYGSQGKLGLLPAKRWITSSSTTCDVARKQADVSGSNGNGSAWAQMDERNGTVWDQFLELFVGEEETKRRYVMRNIPYYFLRDELGISEPEMLRISLNHGQVLSMSVENTMRPKVQWLQSMLELRRSEVARIVSRAPGLLMLSLEDNLVPKMEWFCNELGLSPAERKAAIVKCPALLTTSTGSLLLKLEFFREELGLTGEDIQRTVQAMPSLLVLSLDSIQDKVDFLHAELNMTIADVASLLPRAPALFAQQLDQSLRPKVRLLRRELGFSSEAIRRMLLLVPRFLNYDIAGRARPLITYLSQGPMRLTGEQIRRIITRVPSLLATDVRDLRFRGSIEALKEVMGTTEGGLASIVQRFPQALVFRAERIRGCVQLLQVLLQCDAATARTMLQRHPQMIGYRPTSMADKLRFLAQASGADISELRAAVVKWPAVLSYGIKGRLEPRLKRLREAGLGLEQSVTWLILTPERFEEKVLKEQAALQKKKAAGSLVQSVAMSDKQVYSDEKQKVFEELSSFRPGQ